ncbi:MAG TPA: head GIN domain-containing protein [Chryseosolibacter sp.]|nr:head GIN domain-containing protein [Chryseosolibacter sp.]
MKNRILTSFFVLLLSATMVNAQSRETRTVDRFTKISFRFPGKLYLKQGSPQKVELEGDKKILEEVETEVQGSKLIIGKEGNDWFDWKWNDGDEITVYVTVPNIEAVSVSGSGDIIGEGRMTAGDLDLAVSGSGSLTLEVDATGEVEADVSGSGDILIKGKCQRFNSDISGSGKVDMTLAVKNDVDVSVSGSGKILGSGSADEIRAAISGSGKVLAADLQTNRCEVRISGSGDVEINVKNELDATISGSGSVSYKGNPNKVNSNASGSGKLRKI